MEDDYYLDTDIKAQYELDEKIHIGALFFCKDKNYYKNRYIIKNMK